MPTVQEIQELIKQQIEPIDPAKNIREVLKEFEGKLVSKRIIARLTEAWGEHRFRLRRQYGMTHLEWGDYGQYMEPKEGEYPGGSLLLAHSEKNVLVDMIYLDEHNQAYFGAAVSRNRNRNRASRNLLNLTRLAFVINQHHRIQSELKELLDGPFDVVSCAIEKEWLDEK